jgi:hypothetical protein
MTIADGIEKLRNATTPPIHEPDARVPMAIASYVEVGPELFGIRKYLACSGTIRTAQ